MAFEPDSFYVLALKSAGNRNYGQAIDYLKEQLSEDSTFTEAYLRLADFYRYDKNLVAGQQYLQKALQKDPKNSNLYLGLAYLAKYSDDWSSTFEYSEEAIKKGSLSPTAISLLVESALNLETTNKLPRIFRRLKKIPSQKHLYDLGYAIWRYKIKNYKRARSTLSAYLEDNKDKFGHYLLGKVLQNLNNYSLAKTSFFRANQLSNVNEPYFNIKIMSNLGIIYFETGLLDSAEYYYSKALTLARINGALTDELNLHITFTKMFKKMERYSRVAESCINSINLATELNVTEDLPFLYFDLGNAYQEMSDRIRALKYYNLAFDEGQKTQMAKLSASALIEIAIIFKHLNKPDEAIKNLTKSIDISNKARLTKLENEAWFNLGKLYASQGDLEHAKKIYEKVFRYARYNEQYDRAEICLIKLAKLYITPHSNLDNATYYINRADLFAKETSQLQFAATLRWLQGEISLLQNNIEKAETYFLNAIQIGRETGSYNSILAGNMGLVKTYLKANFPRLATARTDSVLNFISDFGDLCMGNQIIVMNDLFNDFFSCAMNAYSKVGDLFKLYDICEKYKALKHIDNISNIRFKIKSPIADSTKWKLNNYKNLIEQKWSKLWELWSTDNRDNFNLVMEIKNDINRLLSERKSFLLYMAKVHPDYYKLTQPTIEPLARLRSILENLNSSFIHYLVGKETTDVLLIRADSIFYKQVKFGNNQLTKIVQKISPLFANDSLSLSNSKNALKNKFRLDLAGQLYKIIFEPLKSWIPAQNSVIISTDKVLNQIPFECLVTNTEDLKGIYDYHSAKFLIEDFNISYVPYAKFLDWPLKNNPRSSKSVIIFANSSEYFQKDRNNYNSLNNNGHYLKNDPDKSIHDSNRLEKELDSISQIIGEQNVDVYSGQNSSKDRFLSQSTNYRLIHLAVPVLLNNDSPLYSKIFFSKSKGGSDFLETFEIFNLRLKADMIVMNACTNTSNPISNNQDLNTLVHAFNFSGVSSLIANMWENEPDIPSDRLMSEFYSNLKLGLMNSEALRQAKVSFIKTVNPNPHFWARLILLGIPHPVDFETSNKTLLMIVTVLSVIVLMIIISWQIMRLRGTRVS